MLGLHLFACNVPSELKRIVEEVELALQQVSFIEFIIVPLVYQRREVS